MHGARWTVTQTYTDAGRQLAGYGNTWGKVLVDVK